jgi:hypothetical protein
MPPMNSFRMLGSTSVIGSSALWWISYKDPSSKLDNRYSQKYMGRDPPIDTSTFLDGDRPPNRDPPFSSVSIDASIRRGGW